ncbi:hypothetical protein ACVIIW_006037 [Bradyrhizobium sp. USDA 4449]
MARAGQQRLGNEFRAKRSLQLATYFVTIGCIVLQSLASGNVPLPIVWLIASALDQTWKKWFAVPPNARAANGSRASPFGS